MDPALTMLFVPSLLNRHSNWSFSPHGHTCAWACVFVIELVTADIKTICNDAKTTTGGIMLITRPIVRVAYLRGGLAHWRTCPWVELHPSKASKLREPPQPDRT